MMLEQNLMVLPILHLSMTSKKNPAPLHTVHQAWSSPRHQKDEQSPSLRVSIQNRWPSSWKVMREKKTCRCGMHIQIVTCFYTLKKHNNFHMILFKNLVFLHNCHNCFLLKQRLSSGYLRTVTWLWLTLNFLFLCLNLKLQVWVIMINLKIINFYIRSHN